MDEEFITVELMVDLQYPDWFKKGDRFLMDRETSEVFGFEPSENKWMIIPLRQSISGYMWLLKTEGKKYLREVK
jgi:hypothetical protein